MNKTKEFEWPFEISGFGGGYEQACRDMTKAGVLWLREHPDELAKWRKGRDDFEKDHPGERFPYYQRTAGEKKFEDAIVKACDDCIGAMFGAAKGHAIAIFDMGWDAYVDNVMTAREKKDEKD